MLSKSSILMIVLVVAPGMAAQSSWGAPVFETGLNSSASDTGPHLSDDGLTLHFASYRTGDWEVFSASRPNRTTPWGPPTQELALGGTGPDDQPFLAASGVELYLASTRTGGAGGYDILRSVRAGPGLPWGTPTFVTEINSSGSESAPSLTADGTEIYFLTTGWGAPAAPNNAIAMAYRPSGAGPFGTPTMVAAVATPNTHRDVAVSPDGLTLMFTEYLPAPVSRIRVFQSTRLTRTQAFGAPVQLTELDSVGTLQGIYSVSPSADGLEMVLAAGFAAAAGSQELMTSRYDGLWHSGFAGVTVSMNLHFRDGARPGFPYILAAAAGNTGFMLGTLYVPLDYDLLFILTAGNDIPPFTSGFLGLLDPQGEAMATIGDPIGFLVGAQIWLAGASIDPGTPTGAGVMSSAFQIEFQLL